MLNALQSEHSRLKSIGETKAAEEILDLCSEICAEADQRAIVCDLLSVWDKNQNGQWDADEIEQYSNEVATVYQHLVDSAHNRQWYVMLSGFVFGPTSIPEEFDEPKMMISFKGQTRWVRYNDAQRNAQFSVDEPPDLPAQYPQPE